MKRLRSQSVTLLLVGFALLFAVGIGCDEPPVFEGEGDILDSPMSVSVFGEYAYVTNSNFDLSGGKEGWISVIDVAESLRNRKQCIISRVVTPPYIAQMVIVADGSMAYLANRLNDDILLIDLSDPELPEIMDLDPDKAGEQGIPAGIEPISLALSPDETLLFVANVGSNNLSIIDTVERRLIKNEYLGTRINDVTVDPQGEFVYVSNRGVNAISMMDVETGNFVTSFTIGDPRVAPIQDTREIAFSSDGRYAYIAAQEPPSLMILDTEKLPHFADRAVLKYIPMDSKPTAVTLSPDGSEIWVGNFTSSNVYVVDAVYYNIIDVIPVGIGPYSIDFAENPSNPGHYFAYVANFFSHNVTLIDAKYKEVVWAIP